MKRSLVVTLGVLSAFGPLSIDLYLPALPQVARDLQVTPGAAALTLTACTLGLGTGQLILGPVSDRWGRRVPLLAGVALFTLLSLVCAVAQTMPLLVTARFGQAVGGSAGIVLARAIARDVQSGPALVRLFSLMFAINGLAPVVAPLLGGQLLRVGSWRLTFVTLALLGALTFAVVWRVVPESLPVARRQHGGLKQATRAYRSLLADRRFVALVLTGAFAFATLFAYISAAPFVLQDHYGFSAQLFSAVFAANAVGLVLGTRLAIRVGVACRPGGAGRRSAGGAAERTVGCRTRPAASGLLRGRLRHRAVQPHGDGSCDADAPTNGGCSVGAAGRGAVRRRWRDRGAGRHRRVRWSDTARSGDDRVRRPGDRSGVGGPPAHRPLIGARFTR